VQKVTKTVKIYTDHVGNAQTQAFWQGTSNSVLQMMSTLHPKAVQTS